MPLTGKWINLIFRVATGGWKTNLLFAPMVGAFYLGLIDCFILLSFFVGRSLHFPRISYSPWNPFAGGLAVAFGLFLMLLSVSYFVKAKGTPLFIMINVWELRKVEEPELMKRLGKDYAEYRERVPMFFPCCRKKT